MGLGSRIAKPDFETSSYGLSWSDGEIEQVCRTKGPQQLYPTLAGVVERRDHKLRSNRYQQLCIMFEV